MADPKIKYDIEAAVSGASDVDRLAVELEKLDSSFDPAVAGRAKELATQLRSLGEQQAAVARFIELKTQLEASKTALADAQTAAQQLGQALAQTETPTRSQTGQMQKLGDAVRAAKTDVQAQTQALDAARSSLTGFGLSTEKLAQTEVSLRTSIAATAAESTKVAESYRTAATAATEAGKAVESAFGATGVRSSQQIRAELLQLDESLKLLRTDATVTGADFDRAFASAKTRAEALRNELTGTSKSTSLLGDSIKQAAAYFSLFTFGHEFIEANTQLETLRRTLALVTGSTETAAKQIDFLRKTADASGAAVGLIAGAYSKFVASAGSAGIALDVVNRTFTAVSAAAGNLGLSSEETSAALTALSQSASKGKVQMEELGQQLGDRLPAVLATTAKGLGVTTAELTKLIQSGELLADNSFFNAFSAGIEQTFVKGQTHVEGFNAELGRLKNAFNEVFTDIGDSGVLTALSGALQLAGGAVHDLWVEFQTAGRILGAFIGFTIDIQRALLTLDFNGARASVQAFGDAVTEIATEGANKLGKLSAAIDKVKDRTSASGDAAKAAAAGHAANAQAVGQAGDEAAAASDKWVALTVAYNKLIEKSAQTADAAEKLAKAKKSESDAAVKLAELAGDEVVTRGAAAAAARGYQVALEAVASAKQSEADLSQIKIAALTEEATRTDSLTDARKRELLELQQKLPALQAEALASKEAAEGARIEAEQRALLIELVRDNSGRLVELKAAYLAAHEALVQINADEKAGLATKDEVNDANHRLAVSEALYHDALEDTGSAIGRNIERLHQKQSVTEAGLNAQKAALQAEVQLAQYNDDAQGALNAQIKIKQLDIEITVAKINVTNLEAKATLAKAEADRAAADAEGKLTDAKKLEIDASIAAAQVKLLESKAAEAGLAVLQRQLQNLVQYGDENKRVRQGVTTALGAEIDAYGNHTKAVQGNREAGEQQVATFGKLVPAVEAVTVATQSLIRANVLAGSSTEILSEKTGVFADKSLRAAEAVAFMRSNVDSMATGLEQAGGSAEQLADRFGSLITTSANVNKGFQYVGDAANTVDHLMEGVEESTRGVDTVWSGIGLSGNAAAAGANALSTGLAGTRDAAADALPAINQLAAGFDNLSERQAIATRNARLDREEREGAIKSAADRAELGKQATEFVNSPAYLLGQKQQSGELTSADAADAQRNFAAASANLQAAQRNPGSNTSAGYRSIMEAYQQALLIRDGVNNLGKGSGTILPPSKPTVGPSSVTTATAPTVAEQSTSHTVTVNIGGTATSFNTATASDADKVTAMLKSLEIAARSAGY